MRSDLRNLFYRWKAEAESVPNDLLPTHRSDSTGSLQTMGLGEIVLLLSKLVAGLIEHGPELIDLLRRLVAALEGGTKPDETEETEAHMETEAEQAPGKPESAPRKRAPRKRGGK